MASNAKDAHGAPVASNPRVGHGVLPTQHLRGSLRSTGMPPTPAQIIQSSARARLACERVRAVVEGRTPDRVPFIDSYWESFARRYRADRGLPPDASLEEHFDHDLVLLAPRMGPWPGAETVVRRETGGYLITRDEYGLVTRTHETLEVMPQHLESRINVRADLDRYPFEDPADPARRAALARDLPHACNRFCPVLKLGGPFSRSWRLRGLARFLEDIAEDEPFVREMVDRMTSHLIAVGKAAVSALAWPPIQMHIADDFASTAAPLLSPRSFERVFAPSLRRMVDTFHAMGFRVSYESEGNIWPMLELLKGCGVDGLAHMEPRAGMSIERIRERWGSAFFVMGNVCNTQVLPSNDRGRVAREVHRVLSSARAGGYMRLSAHSVGPDISSDTYDYFVKLMDRYGRYPMDLTELEREMGRGG